MCSLFFHADFEQHERNEWFAAIELEGGNADESNFSSSDSEEVLGKIDSNPSSQVSTISRSSSRADQVQSTHKPAGSLKKRPIFHST